jgi:Flp pilus assembly protein TadG
MTQSQSLRNRRPGTRGQALAETGMVIAMLTLVVMGIADVAWAFTRTAVIENAARDGARWGAALNAPGDRDPNTSRLTGQGTGKIQSHVQNILNSLKITANVNVDGAGCQSGVPVVTVTIAGNLNTLFKIVGNGFAVNRSVIFEDEGRRTC